MRSILIILALTFSIAWSAEPIKANPQRGQQQSKPEKAGTEHNPIFVKGDVTTKKDSAEASNDAQERKHKADADSDLVLYTGLLALFTFLLFCFTAALWWVTYSLSKDAKITSERQGREMQKSLEIAEESAYAMRNSADAAEEAADAMRVSVRLSKATSIRELRAYVGITYPEIKIDLNRLIAWFDYSNTGETPAHNVELKVSAEILDNFPEFIPPWKEPGTKEDIGKGGVLLPGVTWQKYCRVIDPETKKELDLTDNLRGSLEIHKRRVWVWGTISYQDIFNKWCCVKFRFSSGRDVRKDSTRHKLEYFPLIADVRHTTAEWGKNEPCQYQHRQQDT